MLAIIIPVNAYTIQYDDNTKVLTVKDPGNYELRLYPIYKTNKTYTINRTVYDPSSKTYSNTTLGNISVYYTAYEYLNVERVWSNETLSIEVSLTFRDDFLREILTFDEYTKFTLPRDVKGYTGIYNITVLTSGTSENESSELTLVVEINGTPEKIDLEIEDGKDYDESVVMGDNAYAIVNVHQTGPFNWEILGLNTIPNGTIRTNSPNDEVWIIVNTTWLHETYGLTPKSYSFHVSSSVDAYRPLNVSKPKLSCSLSKDAFASGLDLEVTITSNVMSTKFDLDGPENRLYVAIVRGVYTGDVEISNGIFKLPEIPIKSDSSLSLTSTRTAFPLL
jgi:hypothetical protein